MTEVRIVFYLVNTIFTIIPDAYKDALCLGVSYSYWLVTICLLNCVLQSERFILYIKCSVRIASNNHQAISIKCNASRVIYFQHPLLLGCTSVISQIVTVYRVSAYKVAFLCSDLHLIFINAHVVRMFNHAVFRVSHKHRVSLVLYIFTDVFNRKNQWVFCITVCYLESAIRIVCKEHST